MKFATQMFNISHQTSPMLLHYLEKFKSSKLLQIRKMQTKCVNFYTHPFNVTHLLTYCLPLLTYYFSFWFLLNILWKGILFYAQRSGVNIAVHTGHATLYDCTTIGNTSSTGQDLWPLSSPDLTLVYCKMWDVIRQRVCRLTLTTRSNVREHLTWHKPQHNWQCSWQVSRSSLITCTKKIINTWATGVTVLLSF